jgi:DNA-binding transcriptional ArsR family regulator
MDGKPRKRQSLPSKETEKPSLDLSGIPDDVVKVLEGLPEDKRTKIISALLVSVRQTTYSGPIPHPDIAKGWDEIVENGADRLMRMAEKQLDHRIELEKFAIHEQHRQSGRGQVFGFILALVFGGVAVFWQ